MCKKRWSDALDEGGVGTALKLAIALVYVECWVREDTTS